MTPVTVALEALAALCADLTELYDARCDDVPKVLGRRGVSAVGENCGQP